MQRLNIRNITDEIFRLFEAEASRQERSLEAHGRYLLTQSVLRDNRMSGAELYAKEFCERLNQVLPVFNRALDRPGPGHQKPVSKAELAERLGEKNPLSVLNWFSGDSVPDFEHAERLADYLGCSRRWLKFGEGRMYDFDSFCKCINQHGSAYNDARTLLGDDDSNNPVRRISIIREADSGKIMFLREFRKSMKADVFWTNIHLSGKVGHSGSVADLCDFFCILEQLWFFYTSNDLMIKSYNTTEMRLKLFTEEDCHPLNIPEYCCTPDTWWEDIWNRYLLSKRNKSNTNNGYFWHGDTKIIDDVLSELEKENRLCIEKDKAVMPLTYVQKSRYTMTDEERESWNWGKRSASREE